MHNNEAITPAWVMCGAEVAPGHVVLLASKDLTQAELEEHADDFLSGWSPEPARTHREFVLSTTMRSFIRIEAADWQSAFNRLFGQWSPETDQPGQIDQRRSITASHVD